MRLRLLKTGDGRPLRILSANVWAHNPSPGVAVSAILARDADVVLLQESDGSVSQHLARLKSRYPYASECPRAGVQIFVKAPIQAQGWGLGLGSIANRNTVWVETTLPDGRRVTLVTVHFVQPIPPGTQEAMREALASRLRSLPAKETVLLAGDFNTTPWSYAMRRQDKMLQPLRRRTIALFSWPARLTVWRRNWPFPILPIDHLYAGSAWGKSQVTRVRIPGSDHFATEAVFWPERTRSGWPPSPAGGVGQREDGQIWPPQELGRKSSRRSDAKKVAVNLTWGLASVENRIL
jgi:endonuclease/exonuclease/phosphatase (EEP) superfamily protein YafD